MATMKDRKRVYIIAGALLVVGAICYAAFPIKQPEQPIRLMFQAVSGNVLFHHKTHASQEGYGIDCFECHHHSGADETEIRSCKYCHPISQETDTAPQACLDCHDQSEIKNSLTISSGDAFHMQCAGCHEDYGQGPKEQECSSCHVL